MSQKAGTPASKPPPKAETYRCAHKGCAFEATAAPENCPVCGQPFAPHPAPETL